MADDIENTKIQNNITGTQNNVKGSQYSAGQNQTIVHGDQVNVYGSAVILTILVLILSIVLTLFFVNLKSDSNEPITPTPVSQIPPANTPILMPQIIPTPKGTETIKYLETRHISLVAGELIVGTADRFQENVNQTAEPPFTAFLIKGPIEMDLTILDGGWDDWINVYDSHFEDYLINQKVNEIKQHPTYPQRGLKVVRLPQF